MPKSVKPEKVEEETYLYQLCRPFFNGKGTVHDRGTKLPFVKGTQPSTAIELGLISDFDVKEDEEAEEEKQDENEKDDPKTLSELAKKAGPGLDLGV